MEDTARRLELIIRLIELSQDGLRGSHEVDLSQDRLLFDATAFRVMHIGENAGRLDVSIRHRHTHLITGMRNVLAHEYAKISAYLVRRTVTEHLNDLKTICLKELAGEALGD